MFQLRSGEERREWDPEWIFERITVLRKASERVCGLKKLACWVVPENRVRLGSEVVVVVLADACLAHSQSFMRRVDRAGRNPSSTFNHEQLDQTTPLVTPPILLL